MAQIQEFVEQIKGMTVLELNELVKALETEFGVSAAAAATQMAVVGVPPPGAPSPGPPSRPRRRPSST
jgi:large subunit ribosomal protein L7/L12